MWFMCLTVINVYELCFVCNVYFEVQQRRKEEKQQFDGMVLLTFCSIPKF